MNAKINIFRTVKLLEAKKGRPYSAQDIAKATGLHRHTVSSMLEGREDKTLSKVLSFFAREGMPVAIGDLFVITDDNPDNPT